MMPSGLCLNIVNCYSSVKDTNSIKRKFRKLKLAELFYFSLLTICQEEGVTCYRMCLAMRLANAMMVRIGGRPKDCGRSEASHT